MTDTARVLHKNVFTVVVNTHTLKDAQQKEDVATYVGSSTTTPAYAAPDSVTVRDKFKNSQETRRWVKVLM